jgi:hypothetical protein
MTNFQRESVIECEGLFKKQYKAAGFMKLETQKSSSSLYPDKMSNALKPAKIWFSASNIYVCLASDGDYYFKSRGASMRKL